MNVIDAHLVGYSEAAESHIVSLHGVIGARGYQRISLKDISFFIYKLLFLIFLF